MLARVARLASRTYTDLDDIKDIMSDKGQNRDSGLSKTPGTSASFSDFVLDKSIFSNVFEKDIRRVYLYKKCERLAKAIHLVSPAFATALPLKDRLDRLAIALVDAAVLPPRASKEVLMRELLTLSSMLSLARTGGSLSPMNADLILKEAQLLLGEVAGYEEPRLELDELPSLASLAKSAVQSNDSARLRSIARVTYDPLLDGEETEAARKGQSKRHIKDIGPSIVPATPNSSRRESVLAILREKGPSYIKDISLVIREVSEKTIQRELAALVSEGVVKKEGERRWTTYSIA